MTQENIGFDAWPVQKEPGAPLWAQKKSAMNEKPPIAEPEDDWRLFACHAQGWLAKRSPRKRWQICRQSIHQHHNMLNRNFKAEQPNKKGIPDIACISIEQGSRTLFLGEMQTHRSHRAFFRPHSL